MIDLSLIDTDDLVAELKRRCDGFILGMERDATTERNDVSFEFDGGLSRAMGMTYRLLDRLTHTDRVPHQDTGDDLT